jgi:DNA-binding transcriptional LysR family regulator
MIIVTITVQKTSINSDQLLTFLAVCRNGNTLAAARRLALDHSTVSRRISGLEEALNLRLFERSPRGLAPTAAARALLPHAEKIERELDLAGNSVITEGNPVSGVVRLATPEVFGTHIAAPAISDLLIRHPQLQLELVPQSRSISLSKREADLAVTLHRPPRGRLVARKLVDYRLGLFASRNYLEGNSKIRSAEDLKSHRFVSYVDDLVDDPEILALNKLKFRGHIVFRSSSSFVQQAAVAQGVGLGLLHRFVALGDPSLVPVLPIEINVTRTYWLVTHADLQKASPVRAIIDFLVDVVNQKQFDA